MATEKESKEISRRRFVKGAAIGSAGLLIATDLLNPDRAAGAAKSTAHATMVGVPFEARERVRLGIIGVGGRGTNLLEDLLAIEKVDVKAICDLVPAKVAKAQKAVTDAWRGGVSSAHLVIYSRKNIAICCKTIVDLDGS